MWESHNKAYSVSTFKVCGLSNGNFPCVDDNLGKITVEKYLLCYNKNLNLLYNLPFSEIQVIQYFKKKSDSLFLTMWTQKSICVLGGSKHGYILLYKNIE